MKAYLPWYLPQTFDEWLENIDIESDLFNEPDKVPDEILDWIKDNYWQYVTANEDGYIDDFADTFVDILEGELPHRVKLTRLDKGQLYENHLIEVEIDDPVELFENGDLILSNLDEIYKYLDDQQDLSVSSEDLREFLNTEDVQIDPEDDIDQEIEKELVNFDFENMDPELAGALIIYFAGNDLYELLFEADGHIYWYEYTNWLELLKKVNEVFSLNPPADDFLELENYTENGGEFEYSADSPGQLKLQFESLRKLKTRLQVILEDFSPDAFNYMKKEYGLSDEQVKSELATKTQIDNMFSKDSDIYRQALQKMAPDEIDHHESDLYLKKNEVSDKLISNYKFKNNVTIFRDQIDGVLWYDIPFAYHREFDEKVDESLVLRLKKLTEGDVINFADFKRQKEAQKNLDNALQINIKKIIIKWCETAFGNGFFKDNEEMSYEEFQKRIYAADYFLQQYEGVCKCAYIAVMDLTENGKTEEETYEGKIYLGEGKENVNLLVNMEEFINEATGKAVFFDNVPVTMTDAQIETLAKMYKAPYKEPEQDSSSPSQNSLVKDYSNNDTKTAQDVEVGDILYTSWGYDMTIVDFYRVTERKKASIRLEALAHKAVSGEPGNNEIVPIDKVVPDENVDGKLFRLTKYGVCQIDGHTARYWNGKPKYYNTYD